MGRAKRDIGGTVRELVASYGSIREAARATGIPFSTLQGRHALEAAATRVPPAGDELEYPELPGSELPAEDLIDQACARFSRHLAAREARRWFEIGIKSNLPIGIAWVGDPHIDSPGCAWPLLRSHIKILEETEGMYAVGIGDLCDNWTGRLARLYADSEISKKAAWKIAAYILRDTGIRWLVHLLGNHDLWGDGEALIKANAQHVIPVEEWQARFAIAFPNGTKVRVHAAHDFKGSSVWNQLHGPQRQALWGEECDILVAGHKHNWATAQSEHPHKGHVYHLIRVRGYKEIDSYATQLGFGSQRHGATILSVIDPGEEGPKRIVTFPDLEEGAEFLQWKRERACVR